MRPLFCLALFMLLSDSESLSCHLDISNTSQMSTGKNGIDNADGSRVDCCSEEMCNDDSLTEDHLLDI